MLAGWLGSLSCSPLLCRVLLCCRVSSLWPASQPHLFSSLPPASLPHLSLLDWTVLLSPAYCTACRTGCTRRVRMRPRACTSPSWQRCSSWAAPWRRAQPTPPAAADSLRRACKVGGFPLLPGGWLQNAASRQLRALPWPGQLVVGSPTHCPLFALLSPTHPPALILTLALTPCPAAELPGRAERAPHRPPGGGRQAAGGGRVPVGAGLAGREGGPAEKAGQGGLGSARLGKMGGAWLLVCLLGNVSSSWACHASALLPSAALPSPACLAAL